MKKIDYIMVTDEAQLKSKAKPDPGKLVTKIFTIDNMVYLLIINLIISKKQNVL